MAGRTEAEVPINPHWMQFWRKVKYEADLLRQAERKRSNDGANVSR